MPKDHDKDGPIVIKKYANRRLYNTESSTYVTLDHLAELVKEDRNFVVRDAKTGEDITRSVLTQIIFEQENKGQTLLPVPFLRQLISFYGDGLQAMVPGYLQSSMEAFTRNQEQIRTAFQQSLSPGQALAVFDEMTRQNMTLFQRTMEMFTPFSNNRGPEQGQDAPAGERPTPPSAGDAKIEALEERLASMQRQLDDLRNK